MESYWSGKANSLWKGFAWLGKLVFISLLLGCFFFWRFRGGEGKLVLLLGQRVVPHAGGMPTP